MRRISWSVLTALLFSSAGTARAGVDQAGTTSANFLSVGTGARALGMGGATLGLVSGLAAASWNAGALGWIDQGEMTLSHAGLSDETSQESAAFGGKLHGPMRWAMTGLYQGEGSFEGRDASNVSTGTFDVSSMALGAQLAGRLGSHASLGVGAKWVSENLGPGLHGSGLAFDAGILARFGVVGLGVAAQNLGSGMTYDAQSFPFPTNVGAGIAIAHPRTGLKADLDVNVPNDYYANVRGGVEWEYHERLALRAGYRKEVGAESDDALNGPSFGMGAGAYGVWIDYGYLVTESGEGQHRMGITLHPGHLGWTGGDPFGQNQMPRDFDDTKIVGPPDPKARDTKKK